MLLICFLKEALEIFLPTYLTLQLCLVTIIKGDKHIQNNSAPLTPLRKGK